MLLRSMDELGKEKRLHASLRRGEERVEDMVDSLMKASEGEEDLWRFWC